jgi:hypothetical protein
MRHSARGKNKMRQNISKLTNGFGYSFGQTHNGIQRLLFEDTAVNELNINRH